MSLGILWALIWLGTGISILMLVSTRKIFRKAGLHGYEILIPVHNIYARIVAAGRPGRWIFLLVVPFLAWMSGVALVAVTLNVKMMIVGIALGIILGLAYFIDLNIQTGRRFGKSGGFIFGMIILPIIFYPILGLGDSVYTPRLKPTQAI